MIKVIKNSKYLILFCLLTISSQTFSQGSKYTGTYKKSAPITYNSKTDIIIEGLEFSDLQSTIALRLEHCSNVIIRNCKFKNNFSTPSIYAYKGTNILITDCTFENVHQGFVAGECYDNIKFENNNITNLVGNLYGGSQFSNAATVVKSKGAGYSLSYNVVENIAGKSSPEDVFNIYQSSGTAASPIMLKGNWIRGGGPSPSGGGIILGDWGGSYQIAEGNILVNPGMYGIGIVGGKNNTLRNNKVYSKQLPHSGVGVQAADYTPSEGGPASNIVIENNEVNFTNSKGVQETIWFDASMRKVVLNWATSTIYNPELNEDILPKVIINIGGNTNVGQPDENQPDENQPTTPESLITKVYLDRFNRIAIKYLVSPIPIATAESYTSTGQLIGSMTLPRFNKTFPGVAPKGEYYVKIIYSELGKTEITKLTVN